MRNIQPTPLALFFALLLAACTGDVQRLGPTRDGSADHQSGRHTSTGSDASVIDGASSRPEASASSGVPPNTTKDASSAVHPPARTADAAPDGDVSDAHMEADTAGSALPFPPPTSCPSHFKPDAVLFETTRGLITYASQSATGTLGPRDIVMSRDGEVIAGFFATQLSPDPKVFPIGDWFRWQSGRLVDLGNPAGKSFGKVRGIDCTGRTIVGTNGTTDLSTPSSSYRWRSADGFSTLQANSMRSYPFAVSADGTIIAGADNDATDTLVPVLWKNDDPPLTLFTMHLDDPLVYTLSADGTEVSGTLLNTDPHTIGIWRTDRTLVAWGRQPGVDRVRGMDPSGTVLLGNYFLWSDRNGFTTIPQDCSWLGLSALGRVVIGLDQDIPRTGDCIWDAKHGVRHLSAVLRSYGVELKETLTLALSSISDDGRVLAGVSWDSTENGRNDAFRAVLPVSAFE